MSASGQHADTDAKTSLMKIHQGDLDKIPNYFEKTIILTKNSKEPPCWDKLPKSQLIPKNYNSHQKHERPHRTTTFSGLPWLDGPPCVF